MKLSWIFIIPLTLGLATAAAAEKPIRLAKKKVAASGLKVGDKVPNFTLPVVNSYKETQRKWGPKKWSGDDGKKLIVMSFFATWCKPCKKEMPELVRLFETYKDDGLGVALVSIDRGMELRDEVVALAEKNKVEFPVVHDRFQVVAKRYDAERLPYLLMVGPDGVVKTVHVGYSKKTQRKLENEIRGHLGMKPLKKKRRGKKRRRRSKR